MTEAWGISTKRTVLQKDLSVKNYFEFVKWSEEFYLPNGERKFKIRK